MIIEVVGLKKVNFTGNDGNQINGVNIYYTAASQPNVVGLETGKVFISNEKLRLLGLNKIEEGSYEIFYNRYQKIDVLRPV